MSKTNLGLAIASLVLVAGCGHYSSGSGSAMVCSRRGQCHYKYSEDARTLSESTRESLDRHLAASSGSTYYPTKYTGETHAQFAERSSEESARQSAFQRGEPYSPPLRSGESADHWLKRSQESSGLFDSFKRDSPSKR